MSSEPCSPALRISHVVYGRSNSGGRVEYLVDPKGLGDERAIPEEVVLRRWRRRHDLGLTFSGERLSPTVWRALPVVLGADPAAWSGLSLDVVRDLRAGREAELAAANLRAPAAETILALLEACGPGCIAKLIERHTSRDRAGRSGVPDLFLFARDGRGRVRVPRFVEVKKPEEPVSADQRDEIAFLEALGLPARVLRLIEREHGGSWRMEPPSCSPIHTQA